MDNNLVVVSVSPVNGVPMMGSKAIVKVLNDLRGERESEVLHKNVIRDIEKMLNDIGGLRFEPSVSIRYFSSGLNKGAVEEIFLNEELSICFVSGKNAKIRMSVVKGFQANRSLALPGTYIEALKALVASEEAKEAAVARAEKAEDTIDFFLNTDGLVSLQKAMRQIGLKPNKALEWLRSHKLMTRDNQPTALMNRKGGPEYFKIKSVILDNNRSVQQTFVTSAGIEWLKSLNWPKDMVAA